MKDALERASGRRVSRETFLKLEAYVEELTLEARQQNLIARSTSEDLWQRHILDSAQLCRFVPAAENGRWLDIGSGAGLPGLVIAILIGKPITLVEPRRLRAEFLMRCVERLSLANAAVELRKTEQVSGTFDIITARAVAALPRLFTIAAHLSHAGTRWVLPKGRSGAKELEEARRSWQGMFRLEPSLTDPDAVIVLAEQVRPRRGPKGGAG